MSMRWNVSFVAADGATQALDDAHGWLDEVVVGQWLHLEQMSQDEYFLRIGDAAFDLVLNGNRLLSCKPERLDAIDIVEASSDGEHDPDEPSVWHASERKLDTWRVNAVPRDAAGVHTEGHGELAALSVGAWLEVRLAAPGQWRVHLDKLEITVSDNAAEGGVDLRVAPRPA
jgi:hypothetical protein